MILCENYMILRENYMILRDITTKFKQVNLFL